MYDSFSLFSQSLEYHISSPQVTKVHSSLYKKLLAFLQSNAMLNDSLKRLISVSSATLKRKEVINGFYMQTFSPSFKVYLTRTLW